MAREKLWREKGFEVVEFPADWDAFGKRAGLLRNADMVDALVSLRELGLPVAVAAFLMPCSKPGCRESMPHYSHGAAHCARLALTQGLVVVPVTKDHVPGVSR